LDADVKEELRLKPLLCISPLKEDTVIVKAEPGTNYYLKYGNVELVLGRKVRPGKNKDK
jgi:hypothetical protein